MTMTTADLGVLGELATAIGLFEDGAPNSDWFGRPDHYLARMLSDDDQRTALVAFVDEVLGGQDRTTAPGGTTWLPVVSLRRPADPVDLDVCVTIADDDGAPVRLGLGLSARTTDPVASRTTIEVPLFQVDGNGVHVSEPFLLGQPGGRIRLATTVTVGTEVLEAIGLDLEVPTHPSDGDPSFGLTLTGIRLPGAPAARDIRVAAGSPDELDDAVLDLVLALVRSVLADPPASPRPGPAAPTPTQVLTAVAGMLGLVPGDAVPDFPVAGLVDQGVAALTAWLHDVLTTEAQREAWIDHLADLFEAEAEGSEVVFAVPGTPVSVRVGVRVGTDASGHALLTPTLGVDVRQPGSTARAEARVDLAAVDLVTGSATAVPALGIWASIGSATDPLLVVAGPPAVRVERLRLGFALDDRRRPTFVLAADDVTIGDQAYAVLDLTSPDALMDAAGNAVGDVVEELVGGLGTTVRVLLGLDGDPSALVAFASDPVGHLASHWRGLLADHRDEVVTALGLLRDGLADAAAGAVSGEGRADEPWRLPLVGPLALHLHTDGDLLVVDLAVTTTVDDLGGAAPDLEAALSARLAEIDLAARSASLVTGVQARLSARGHGTDEARLDVAEGLALRASRAGLHLGWTAADGLVAGADLPGLALDVAGDLLPVALPVLDAGTVTFPPQGWDLLQELVGHLETHLPDLVRRVTDLLGWTGHGVGSASGPVLRLADLLDDPAVALRDWATALVVSDVAPAALALLADVLGAAGGAGGPFAGSGHPDDPFRLRLATAVPLPEPVVWFPPAGLRPRVVNVPAALRAWHPGAPGLDPSVLALALALESEVAADVRELVESRDVVGGLTQIALRWSGTDGRLVAPATTPPGATRVVRLDVGASQLHGSLVLGAELLRTPTAVLHVALGPDAWADRPADRVVDLTAPGLQPAMLTAPAPAAGDWFVRLGTRAACRLANGDADGTAGQAARLRVVLDRLATLGDDVVVVGVGGAGHACRRAAAEVDAVSEVVTLGTPYAPVPLAALSTVPEADGLRLLNRLLPPVGPDEDVDLRLARSLVGALMELTGLATPDAELAPPTAQPPLRTGLETTAVFGAVSPEQVSRALTAAVAAGLAHRARVRAATPLPPATGVRAGVRFVLPDSPDGSLRVSGDALLTLAGADAATATEPARVVTGRSLRVRAGVADRLGWLTSTPTAELRKVTADLLVPLGGEAGPPGPGTGRVVLHDARILTRDWEQLVVGPDAEPFLPEARTLLAVAVQRLTDAAAGASAQALAALLEALAVTVDGAVVADAVDQLVRDPGGLLRARLQAAGPAVSAAVQAAVGATGATVDLATGTVRLRTTSGTGLSGWQADVTASPSGLVGTVSVGPPDGLRAVVQLAPFAVRLAWQHPGGAVTDVDLWPAPDPDALARLVVEAAPGLAGHVAVEVLRGLDDALRPTVDAVLDVLGLLGDDLGDGVRRLRSLAPLVADPAGFLRGAGSLASSAASVQALLDALRPLTGVGGAAGGPWPLADGVALAVAQQGDGVRLGLTVDASAWAPPGGADLAAGLTASLVVGPSGPPALALDAFVGLPGAGTPGSQAVHVEVGPSTPVRLFFRTASGGDLQLVPFAGLGGLAEAAGYALPFLLDLLADDGTVGEVVSTVGDALALRTGATPAFDHARLVAWGTNPAAALETAAPSLLAHLADLTSHVDDLVPDGLAVTHAVGRLTATYGDVSLSWEPSTRTVQVDGLDVPVPGIDRLTFRLAVSDQGLRDLTVTVGPVEIDTGAVVLRPFATVAAGQAPVGGRRVLVGLAAGETARFAARWTLDPAEFDLVGSSDPISLDVAPVDDPLQAALRAVEVVADLVASIAMSTPAVGELLDHRVFSKTVRELLDGVLLDDAGTSLIDGLFDPDEWLGRAVRLFVNLAGAGITLDLGELGLSLLEHDGVVGLRLGLEPGRRWALLEGEVSLWLEEDASWIDGSPEAGGGVFVGFLDVSDPDDPVLRPVLTVWGVGLRVGSPDGPLLDLGLTLGSVALHAFASIGGAGAGQVSGGAQLQLTDLAVSASGASGGNGIAAGILADTGTTPPQPAFSPAIAVQKHGTDAVSVTLRAGDDDGPWWIAVQKGFGPLYVEQVGLGVAMAQRRVDRVSVLLDGSVSLFGLTCAVDDLQITYLVSRNAFFDPASWDVDLRGLAVSADLAGLSIAGGLLKNVDPGTGSIEYLGMLLARFGVYGITIYGGYGEGVEAGERFVAFFAVGSVVGPIGGPPAFFLTGIGGGFGINRELVVPTDLSRLGDHPLVKALDVAAKPGNPMDELRGLGAAFPMKRGSFWFAAGLSFTSFALVDGIAVVAVEVGDGLDVNLLGLARMALPRPQVALVSIEIALLVRFSTSEGVLWVQGQLTDNSWLLYEDVRLTGGFAFVTWFKGEHAGEFVLTLGGYHPDFHRDGYPVVPRLGMRWQFGSNIVIQAGSYFALTSEALMAGGDFSASASFGWAWAELSFGAHGIVYFDPFSYKVMAYVRIRAGISVDIWPFGEISMSVSLGARLELEGPDFHGKATIEVGPCEFSVEIGSRTQHRTPPLAADAFTEKYLEASSDGAVTHSVVTTFGTSPSGSGDITPDGTAQRPFKVVAEFGLVVTSTVPVTSVAPAPGGVGNHPPSRTLGVGPMGVASLATTLAQSWQRAGAELAFPFEGRAQKRGAFPVGVWGPPQDDNNRKLPKGEVVEALSEVGLDAYGTPSAGGPEIPYHQVEIGRRIPLPFARTAQQVADLRARTAVLSQVAGAQPTTVAQAFAQTAGYLARTASPAAVAALRGERQAPPRLGTLGEGLDTDAIPVVPDRQAVPVRPQVDTAVRAPVLVGLLRGSAPVANAVARPATTVEDVARLWRTAPPTLASVDAERSRSVATTLVTVPAVATPTRRDVRAGGRLTLAGLPRAAARAGGSVLATGAVPTTAVGRPPTARIGRVAGPDAERLAAFSTALAAGRRSPGDPGAVLQAGDVAVLALPNARRDVGDAARPVLAVAGSPARVLAVGPGAEVLADAVVTDALTVPQGTERLVAVGLGTGAQPGSGLAGWHAGAQLPYLGWSSALGRGCLVTSRGEQIPAHEQRGEAGWVSGAELARGVSTVTTRFAAAVRTVVVVLDDPTALGGEAAGRRLVLGLDGAERVTDARGQDLPPALLTAENRSVLAWAVAPGGGPVTVTVATETGWSLVGVLGATDLDPQGAIALVSARGLDAALAPFVAGAQGATRLTWQHDGPPRRRPTRTPARTPARTSTPRKAR
jgi:hypothetical protein